MHREAVTHIAAGLAEGDPQGRRELGTDRSPGVDRPVLGFTPFGAAQFEKFARSTDLLCRGLVLPSCCRSDVGDQRPGLRAVGRREVVVETCIEHTFDYAGRV